MFIEWGFSLQFTIIWIKKMKKIQNLKFQRKNLKWNLEIELQSNIEIYTALDGNLLIRKDENQTLENIKE